MPQTKDWTTKRPDETFDEYLKRVSKRIKESKTTDWDALGRFATRFVRDVRRDKGAESDAAIMKEVDPGYKYTPKKRKKKIG